VSKDDLSRVSWIALLGLAIVMLGVMAGMPVAGRLVSDEDDAAVAGVVWGALVGAVVGGLIVGALCARAGLSRRTPLVAAFAAPGTLVSVSLLGAIVLSRDWSGLFCVAVLTLSSGLASGLGAFVVQRTIPASP
jgi:hypothetical protein